VATENARTENAAPSKIQGCKTRDWKTTAPMCRCSGPVEGAVVQLVEYRTRNQEVASPTHTRSTASNLEQVANLLCAQANSTSYPRRDGKWVVATRFSQKLSSLELLPLSTTNRKRYSKKVQVQCVDLSDYNIIFEPNLVQSSNTTLSTRRNGQIHITWKYKMAAAAILDFFGFLGCVK